LFNLLVSFIHLKMMTIKTFVICAVPIAQSIEAASPDVLTKRDNAVDVDPYAAYYDQYANQLEPIDTHATVYEKQGFAPAMEAMFGPDAGLVLGAIGALIGTVAAVGVVLNNNNVNNLSVDQDSICTSVRAIGNFDTANTVTLTTAANMAGTTNGADMAAVIIARFNVIENALRNIATPDCE
jgi:hypothetical protein